MPTAIAAALIGALAVVVGVVLERKLTDQRDLKSRTVEITRRLLEEARPLYDALSMSPTFPLEQKRQIYTFISHLVEIEDLAASLRREHRKFVLDQIDEVRPMWVTLEARIAKLGQPSEADIEALARRTNVAVLSVLPEPPPPDSPDFLDRAKYYAGHGFVVPRPGSPELSIPIRGPWRRLRRRWHNDPPSASKDT